MNERWSEMDDLDLLQVETELRGELGELREAATVYADRAWARGAGAAAPHAAARGGWFAWVATGLAAVALTAGGVRLAQHGHTATAQVDAPAIAAAQHGQAAAPVSDEALLEQIQSDLSNGVPDAMEPLQAGDARSAPPTVQQ